MTTKTVVVQPYVCYNAKGELWFTGCTEGANALKPTVDKEGYFTVPLPPVPLTLDLPDDPRPQLVEILRAHRGKLQADHQAMMTRMQFLENQLLGLAAPDVVDADISRGRSVDIDGALDDDIPF